jgi:hypothetical protein
MIIRTECLQREKRSDGRTKPVNFWADFQSETVEGLRFEALAVFTGIRILGVGEIEIKLFKHLMAAPLYTKQIENKGAA